MYTREFFLHRSCSVKSHASHTCRTCSARGCKLHADVADGYS
ncbi:hypothetical protein HMPREF3232_00171 [Fannyhessea vaginae]|nr:hypothetical protein HMPREF3232_00171 [Fannyhessea vaginae]